jgi:hypothetical protein
VQVFFKPLSTYLARGSGGATIGRRSLLGSTHASAFAYFEGFAVRMLLLGGGQSLGNRRVKSGSKAKLSND